MSKLIFILISAAFAINFVQAECDSSTYSDCTCISPAKFTPGKMGNCNVDAGEAASPIWCYVTDETVCPDAVESVGYTGTFWSSLACINFL